VTYTLLTPGRPLATRVLTVVAALLTATGAAVSGLSMGGSDRRLVVLPLAMAVGLILAVVALTRFGIYVMIMLVLRSSIDLAKLSGTGVGDTATNAVQARALDPSSILAVLFLVAAMIWLAAQRRAYGPLPGSSLGRALRVFAFVGVVSVLGAEEMAPSALEAMRIITVVVMFAVLERLMHDVPAMKRFLFAAMLSTVFPLLYSASAVLLGDAPIEEKGDFTRFTGPFTQSNTFGRYLMIIIVFGAALYPHLSRRFRVSLGVVLAGCTLLLLLTYTRSALLGTVAGLVVVGAIQSKRLLAALAVIALCALLFVPQLAARFGTVDNTAQPGSGPSGNTLEWRLSYWSDVLPLASRNPMTGIGLGMTPYYTSVEKQPHSDLLRAYVETGVIGVGSYVVMLVAMVRTGRRGVHVTPPGTFERGVATGFLGCAVAFVAVSAVANVISNVATLWYLMAFAAAASTIVRRNGSAAEQRSERTPQGDPSQGVASVSTASKPTAHASPEPKADEASRVDERVEIAVDVCSPTPLLRRSWRSEPGEAVSAAPWVSRWPVANPTGAGAPAGRRLAANVPPVQIVAPAFTAKPTAQTRAASARAAVMAAEKGAKAVGARVQRAAQAALLRPPNAGPEPEGGLRRSRRRHERIARSASWKSWTIFASRGHGCGFSWASRCSRA